MIRRLAAGLLLGLLAGSARGQAPAPSDGFTPPPDSAIPDTPLGQAIRQGEAIFEHTRQHAGGFVGNALNCASCHLQAGRQAHVSPLWAAYVSFPAFRAKTGQVSTFAERLQDCFRYSMNGRPPPLGDPVLVALESYAAFLARGAPVGGAMAGRGYPPVPRPAPADYGRGAALFGGRCAACHGADGAGRVIDGEAAIPALWGAGSFNWGAGMAVVSQAAGFIKGNMPLGQAGALSDQEAWDVALFVDSHERPQDPRYTGDVAQTRAAFHDTPESMYGRTVLGVVLGAGPADARAPR